MQGVCVLARSLYEWACALLSSTRAGNAPDFATISEMSSLEVRVNVSSIGWYGTASRRVTCAWCGLT